MAKRTTPKKTAKRSTPKAGRATAQKASKTVGRPAAVGTKASRATKSVDPPIIFPPTPVSFIDGGTYDIGVGLWNFTSVDAAFFSQDNTSASFSNTTTFDRTPTSGPPQYIKFRKSTFRYFGSTPTIANLTVTVVSGGTVRTKTVPVTYSRAPLS